MRTESKGSASGGSGLLTCSPYRVAAGRGEETVGDNRTTATARVRGGSIRVGDRGARKGTFLAGDHEELAEEYGGHDGVQQEGIIPVTSQRQKAFASCPANTIDVEMLSPGDRLIWVCDQDAAGRQIDQIEGPRVQHPPLLRRAPCTTNRGRPQLRPHLADYVPSPDSIMATPQTYYNECGHGIIF